MRPTQADKDLVHRIHEEYFAKYWPMSDNMEHMTGTEAELEYDWFYQRVLKNSGNPFNATGEEATIGISAKGLFVNVWLKAEMGDKFPTELVNNFRKVFHHLIEDKVEIGFISEDGDDNYRESLEQGLEWFTSHEKLFAAQM